MNKYIEKERELEIYDKVDVLILGAGPAGFAAAINSAREGCKTMLIEQNGDVGGVSTSGLMSHWTGNTKGGFYEELLDKTSEFATDNKDITNFNGDKRQIINPELLKTQMLEMLEQEKVRIKLYTMCCQPIMDNKTIKGVIIESKSGRQAIIAKIVIDATGDGDIAARAGVPFFKGREKDGKMQPMTLMFKVAGVDADRALFPGGFENTFQLDKGDLQTLGKQHLPSPAGHVLLYKTTLPNIVTCNMTNCINVDGTNSDDLTHATIVCRNQIPHIIDFLQKYVPGYENCFIISSASFLGVRETRHFKGEKTITETDIANARVFKDWAVTNVSFNFDVHCLDGSGLDKTGSQKEFTQKKAYTIPYGCFVPLEIENLMLVGRNISGTHIAHSNFRVMPICVNMGQSVGVAAALCIKADISPRKLQVSALQSRLKELGIKI